MYINDAELLKYYNEISEYYEKYLKEYGVSLPKLKKNKNEYGIGTLVLIYLYVHFKEPVSKKELKKFLLEYGIDSDDVQQARHLGQQKGWYIISGKRQDKECEEYNVKDGEYCLISLTEHYPNFTELKRMSDLTDDEWESIKQIYGYRCATCGSKEGELNIHYPNHKTKLQKGHKDPRKPLTFNNIIPQCEDCNRQDRNNFVYNDKGRVIKIALPHFVLRSDKDVKEEMYLLLKRDLKK